MYDVLYLDSSSREKTVAAGLARDAACEVAIAEARKRNIGRMFLAGSEERPRGEHVLIVESIDTPAGRTAA
jgi:hypothetical protein